MSSHQIEIPEQQKLLSGLLNNVGLAAARDGAGATGIAILRRAMALDPFDAGRRINLASALIAAGEDDEAESLIASALKASDRIVSAWQMLGVLKTHRGQVGEAIACFERGLAINPDGPQQKFDLAAGYLRAGDFARGLPLYEFRSEILPRIAPPPPAPRWNGEKTGHIAVWGDQGHGDRIQFARFLPWVKDRADRVTFLTDPYTVPLLHGYKDKGAVDAIGAFYPPDTKFDSQICLTSLPLLYGLTLDNIPPDPGFISPATTTNSLVAPGLKIGIAWAGNRDHPNDNIRSMPFAELLPLAADPRNDLFSLQCGPAAADIAKARAQRIVGDMSGMIEGEWAHTAAVIQNLDLVVTVDTAIAHLAGAMGIKTFLLIPLFNDWRWLSGRDDSPWYPSMRLYRHSKPLDWKGVMKRVVAAVNQLHQDRAMGRMLNQQLNVINAEYEPDVAAVYRKVLRPGDLVADVGANVGKHVVLAAELVGPTGMVMAFEPGANNLPALREATKRFDNVQIVEQPASNQVGEVTFFLNADDGGGNALWDPADWPGPQNPKSKELKQPVTMQATTLDAQLAGLKTPRLIKIDVEGAEQLVLEGAERLLSRNEEHDLEEPPPFIIAELHEFGLQTLGCTQESLRALMARHGYSTFMLQPDGSLPNLIPDGTRIESGLILNLLFSTQAAVSACWGSLEVSSPGLRSFHAYGLPPAASSGA